MDMLVQEESNRINSTEVLSEFEKEIRLEILAWATLQAEKRSWRETVNAFWNEKFR